MQMPLSHLTRDFAPDNFSPEPTWESEEQSQLEGDEADLSSLQQLEAELAAGATIREPVILSRVTRTVHDGHHRIVAAIRAGVTDIPYVWLEDS